MIKVAVHACHALYLRVHVIDTPNADHKCELALLRHVVATLGLGLTSQTDKILLLQTFRNSWGLALTSLVILNPVRWTLLAARVPAACTP